MDKDKDIFISIKAMLQMLFAIVCFILSIFGGIKFIQYGSLYFITYILVDLICMVILIDNVRITIRKDNKVKDDGHR